MKILITVAHSVCVAVLFLTTNHAATAWNFGFGGSVSKENTKTTTEFNIYDWVVERITGGSPYNTKTIVDESVDDAEVVAAYQSFVDGHLKKAASSRLSSPTSISKRTLTDTIHEDRRFVLYNSRRLSGECLPICYEETPPPTLPPVEETITEPPRNTDRPTGSPTGSPRTDSPTKKPTDGPTGTPTAVPTASPTHSPTDSPTNPPTAGCQCPVNDEHGGSFKCGKDVYLCPGITAICAAQSKSGPEYRYMNDEQCEEMKKVELGEKCIAMPEVGLTQPKSLSNRVCYGGPYYDEFGYKIDGDGCESCKDLFYPPTPSPTNPPSVAPVGGHELDCDKLQDLGYGFSERSGNPSYTGKCYPGVGSLNAPNFNGRDDSVAVFVGGDYWGKNAAEVEGKMVVLGDLRVDSGGPGNFVSVGVGTQVVPNNGQECIKVGGNLKAYRDIQVFNQHSSMNCDIVFKGSATNKNHWKNNGAVRKDANLDLSEYDAMTKVWYKKSKFWGSLNPTATVEYEDWGGSEGETTYRCNNKDEVQIFNVEPNERKKVEGVHTIHFSNSCEGKTILINVRGGGNRAVDAAGMHFKGKQGYGSGGFDTCVKSSILWNFPDATTVNIGNGKTSEFQGSLLITGNLQMTTTGQTGRTIVLGDVTHNRGGSEFHSGEFNPPKPLPDPDCDDLTNGTLELSPSNPPTMAPTSKATEFDGCKTHKDEASRNRGVKDSDCAACTGSQKWWPCDLKPAACEGSKCKLY